MGWKKTFHIFSYAYEFHSITFQTLHFCIVPTYCIGAMNPFFPLSGADIYSTTEIELDKTEIELTVELFISSFLKKT